MSDVEADMESDCTPVNADMSDSSSMRCFLENYTEPFAILQYSNHGSNLNTIRCF